MEVAIRREVGEMRAVGYFEGVETLRWREVGEYEGDCMETVHEVG